MKGEFFDVNHADYNFPCLFLVEGKDDAILLEIMLLDAGVERSEARIIVCGGKPALEKHLGLLVKSFAYLQKVRSVAVLCDADRDRSASLREVHSMLKAVGLPEPGASEILEASGKRCGVYLFPCSGQNGDLEELALQIAPMTETLSEALQFIERVVQRTPEIRKLSKRKVQAFLAGASQEIRPTVGWAFKDGTIPVTSSSLPELADFLRRMASAV